MFFASDNTAGALPEVLDAIQAAAAGFAPSYATDPVTEAVSQRFAEIFEREVGVFLMSTGTAANALAISSVTPPWGAIFCHREAHIMADECGACEFYTGGAKMIGVTGDGAKYTADTLGQALAAHPPHKPHIVPPKTVGLTQATECGRIYQVAEIEAITEVARSHDMAVHMDGARFANAVASLGCAPAEVTWKAGVDLLSFGATKNGCVAAEAVIVFDKAKAEELSYRRMRAGHLISKSRFLAAQIEAYLKDDLWLKTAMHANRMAKRLSDGIASAGIGRVAWPVDANEVFAIVPRPVHEALQAAGAVFHDWPFAGPEANGAGPDEALIRLVASFATTDAHVDDFLAALAEAGRTEAAE